MDSLFSSSFRLIILLVEPSTRSSKENIKKSQGNLGKVVMRRITNIDIRGSSSNRATNDSPTQSPRGPRAVSPRESTDDFSTGARDSNNSSTRTLKESIFLLYSITIHSFRFTLIVFVSCYMFSYFNRRRICYIYGITWESK